MKSKFTKLMAAFTLLVFMMPGLAAWGQTRSTKTEGFESATANTTYNSSATVPAADSDCGIGWTIYYGNVSTTGAITGSNSCLMRYYTASPSNLGYAQTTTGIQGLSNISFNAKVTNTGNKMGVWYSTDQSTWTAIATDVVLNTSSQNKSYNIPNSSSTTTYYIKIGITSATTNKKDLIIDDVVFTYSTGGGSQLTQSDLTITNQSTALTFDLYNNATAQVINYSTSSTGDITINPTSPTSYFSYVHDANAKTITVTPLAVTPSAQTVTISQAADQTYDAGTASFTVSVANSGPLANIAALTANMTAGTYNVALTNAVVTYVNGNYAYIQDASGAVVMYKSSHGLTAGDVLNGNATVAYQLRNNNPQITDLSGVSPVSGIAPNPTQVAQSAWNYTFNDVLSQYFQVTGATITQSNNKYYVSLNNESVQLYKAGSTISSLDLSETYTITGFPTLYNSTKELQVFDDPVVEVSADPTILVSPLTLSGFTYELGSGPSTTQTITVSGENLSTDITLALGNNSDFEMCDTQNGTYTNSLTLTESNGEVNSTTIYVRLKSNLAVDNYSDNITLTSTGATSKTVALSGSVAAVQPPHVTWDLSIASYDAISDPDIVTWSSAYATMTNITANSSTSASNYLGGSNNYTHTRFYKDQVLTITPATGYAISSVVINAMTGYVAGFTGNQWTNASTSVNGTVVTVTPTVGSQEISVVFSAACRATAVTVYYTQHAVQSYDLTVSALSNVEMFVFDANDLNNPLIIGDVTAQTEQVLEGTTIVVSLGAEQGYALATFTVDGVDHLADIEDDAYEFIMPAHNVNITATAMPVYTITYSENGVETQAEVVSTTLTLPTAEDLDSEFSFAGWTTTPGNFVTPTAAGTQVTIQGGETFYAVYARTEGREAYYEKVTENLQDWSGNYLIVAVGTYANEEKYSVAFDGSLVDQGLDASQNSFDVEIESGRIAWDDYNSIAYFTIAPIEVNNEVTGWSIQSASGYYVGRTDNSNGMNISDETAYSHTLSIDENDNAVITSGSTVLRFNKNSGQERFRYYTGSGQQPIQLFKEVVVSQGTPVYYTRVFIMETATANMTITGPSIIPSGSYLDMTYHTLTNNTAANLIIEDEAEVRNVDNNAFAGTMLKDITAYEDATGNAGYYLIASPLEDFEPTAANGFLTQNYDLYAYDATEDDEWINFKVDGGFNLFGYHGYLYASGQNTTLRFEGLLNDQTSLNEGMGGQVVELAYGDANDPIKNLTLVGNSGTAETTFMMYNDNQESVVFNYLTLNEDGDGYNTGNNEYVDVASLNAVFVQAPEANCYMSNEEGYAGKSVQNVNVKVSRVSGNLLDNAIMSYNGSMMRKIYLSDHSTRVYFPISNEDYAVVPAQMEGDQPVNFKANENGTYVLSVEVNNLEMNYLHLIDNMTGADVDLLANPSYTFEARTTDYASRFRLVFSANDVEENISSDNFAFFNGSEWVVSNTGEATLQVVDVLGRVLSTETVNGNATINVNQPTGVYMLRLVNGNNVRVQKIVVR